MSDWLNCIIKMETFIKLIGATIIGLLIMILFAVLVGFPVMWLWNWLMPAIFGIVQIDIWEAIGLNLLCRLLIRSSISTESTK